MTAIPAGAIPNSANATLEKVIAWAGLALQRANPIASEIEVTGLPAERVAQATILTDDNGIDRLIIRTSLPLDPDWKSNNASKLWSYVGDLSTTTIHPTYTS